ncbi:acyltransferase family protein [Gloeothece verrucosa]|uniref:acyltransferase family protein n=1 Tax=Gloeothece verrucosa TaxID=2546359 RepID=UPI0012FF3C83|nr:acyltransferase family protein [Gloeothece verrucosa]
MLWLDNLRAIGIFFVVLVHTGRFSSFISLYIFSFFMPLFFFISGLVAKDSIKELSFKDFFNLRLRRLLIPYIFFSLVSYIVWFFLFRHFGKGEDISPLKPLIGILYGVAIGDWLIPNIAMWFFTCLMMTEIYFFLLIRLPSRKILIAVLFVLSVVGYGLLYSISSTPYRLPWNADLALVAVVFYGVGHLLKPYIFSDVFMKSHRWPVMIISLICYLTFSTLNSKVVFIGGVLGNYLYFFMAAFSGIIFWLYIARLIKPYSLLTAMGQNTLVIFSLHLLVFPFLTAALVYGLKISETALKTDFVALIYSIIAIILLIKVSQIMQKYTPWLLGK